MRSGSHPVAVSTKPRSMNQWVVRVESTKTVLRPIPRALATAWTTLHLRYERQVAEILGIPYERFTQAALITVGFHTGGDFKPAERIPMEPLVHWDRW